MNNRQQPESSGGMTQSAALLLLTSLFFIWGFITCLNDILIPHLKAVFTLNYAQAMLIQFCFFGAYFLVSIPSGYLVDKIGYKYGITLGLTIAGLGCLLFYPAADLRVYPLFLAAFFVLAAGITLLQVSANPYVALLGSTETASSRLTLSQAFNSLGTAIAPYLGALFILSTAIKTPAEISRLSPEALSAYQTLEASSVQSPYLLLATVLFAVALVFALVKLPPVGLMKTLARAKQSQIASESAKNSAWHYPHLVLGAVGIFVYVGAEVSIGSFLVSYLSGNPMMPLTVAEAAKYVSFYWGGAMAGRFVGSAVMRKIRPEKALAFNAASAMLLVVTTLFASGYAAMISILAVGLFNSILFPTLFSLAVAGLGEHTGQGSGILCSAIVGGAVFPVLQGLCADRVGIQLSFVIPVICYAYVAFYGCIYPVLQTKFYIE